MKIKALAAVVVCGIALGAITVEPSAPLFENDQVRVFRARERAHVKAKFHDHKRNRVMVYLQPGRQRFEYQDGSPATVSDFKEGGVEWSPAAGMHAPEVISDDDFNIVEIELKTLGTSSPIAASLDPLKLDPKHYKLEFENAQVRVLRVTIEPNGVTPMHQHSLNRVTVFLTDQDFRTVDAEGKADLVKHKAGDAVWGTPLTHTETNLSSNPFEVLTIEIKG